MNPTLKVELKSLLDLVGILCISLLLIAAQLIPLPVPIRVLLGAPFVLFCPGYILAAALFPSHGELTPLSWLGLSLGLSFAVTF